jgi:acetylornithine deacetylase
MSAVDQLIATLLEAAAAKRDRLVELTQELVRIPSVVGDEAAAARYVEEATRKIGLQVETFEVDHEAIRHHPAVIPMPPETDYRGRPNVVATRRGTGGGRPLYLFGHTDTVPVDPNTTWQHEPFGGEVADGRIYGRGSADMKGGLAIAIAALEILTELDTQLAGDVAAQFVIEEETGGNGTLAAVLAGCFASNGACIQLEPTSTGQVLVSNRGAQFFRITVPGTEGGVEYLHDLTSAIDKSIVVLDAVRAYAAMRETGVDDPLFASHGNTKVPVAICRMQAGAWPSTVPGEAVLEGSIECLPGEQIDGVVAAFERYLHVECAADPWLAEHPIQFETFGLRFDAAGIAADHEFVEIVSHAAQRATGKRPEVCGGGGSDLRLPVLYADCPTILFGPGAGPIHSVDEWVSIDELVATLQVCLITAVEWCGLADTAP